MYDINMLRKDFSSETEQLELLNLLHSYIEKSKFSRSVVINFTNGQFQSFHRFLNNTLHLMNYSLVYKTSNTEKTTILILSES